MKCSPVGVGFADHIMWDRLVVAGAVGKAWIKILLRDPDTNAQTVMVQYEEDRRQPNTFSRICEDGYVLDGEFKVGDIHYRRDCYFYRPKGTESGPLMCQKKAILLIHRGASNDTVYSKKEIKKIDTTRLEWKPMQGMGVRGTNPQLIYEKILRFDEAKGNYILGLMMIKGGKTSTICVEHPYQFEEQYHLEGDYLQYDPVIGQFLLFKPGWYAARPPGTVHGHSSALTDVVIFIVMGGGDPKLYSERRVVGVTVEGSKVVHERKTWY